MILKEINNPQLVVIKTRSIPTKTLSGLDKGSYRRQTVLADVCQIGDDVTSVKVGDVVVVGTMKGTTYKDYKLIYEYDYVAILDK